jgi:hypothetical protein
MFDKLMIIIISTAMLIMILGVTSIVVSSIGWYSFPLVVFAMLSTIKYVVILLGTLEII